MKARRRRSNGRADGAAGLFDELVVDLFAGGGGASMGIERALGRAVDIAINHDVEAVAMHQANHPHTLHYCESIWKAKPHEVVGNRKVGLLWLSPDCFPAGTLVLTAQGYFPIESISRGDMVLTHRGRWRRVTATMESVKPTRTIRSHGHPGLRVSGEHPFYARRGKSGDREWINARDLDKGIYLASPVAAEPVEIPEVPPFKGIWWIVGQYLANGWSRVRERNAEMTITTGKAKAGGVREHLHARTEIKWSERETETAYQFTCHRGAIVAWLRRHFGHLAHAKLIPGWVLTLPEEARREILEGYDYGDGWNTEEAFQHEITTVSKALAFGVKSLAQSLGYTACVYVTENVDGGVLSDGRRIQGNYPAWKVRWKDSVDPAHRQTVRDSLHEWCPIREATDTGTEEHVFNISVEEDESYVAEGIVVHNCCHFSGARGGTPVKKNIRGLAWVAIRWAATVKPRVIMLENVREFQTWGPVIPKLGEDGEPLFWKDGTPQMVPCPGRKGQTFKRWVRDLKRHGYEVEHRVLNAADYGAATHRRRFFLIARCDGEPIVWPEPTHGPGRPHSYHAAAEFIDWSRPCPSIFLSREEAKALGLKCIRPLKPNTLRRIAMGLKRFVLDNPKPFIVRSDHGGDHFRGQPVEQPLSTVTSHYGYGLVTPFLNAQFGEAPGQEPRAHRADEPIPTITPRGGGGFPLIAPHVTRYFGADSGVVGKGVDHPLPTITAQDHHGLIAAHLTQFNGSSVGQRADDPAPTVMAQNQHTGVIAASLVQYNSEQSPGEVRGQTPDRPVNTITADPRFALSAAYLGRHNGARPDGSASSGQPVDGPLPTTTARATQTMLTTAVLGQVGHRDADRPGPPVDSPLNTILGKEHHTLTAANLVRLGQHGGNGSYVNDAVSPLTTVTSKAEHCVAAASLIKQNHGDKQWYDVREPLRTILAGGNHHGVVKAFLSSQGIAPSYEQTTAGIWRRTYLEDVRAFLTKYNRTGKGQGPDEPLHTATSTDRFGLVTVAGVDYEIDDIGLRMLTPRELFSCQGFPPDYILDPFVKGRKLPKDAQTRMVGNSVPPQLPEALVRANFPEECAAPIRAPKVRRRAVSVAS